MLFDIKQQLKNDVSFISKNGLVDTKKKICSFFFCAVIVVVVGP